MGRPDGGNLQKAGAVRTVVLLYDAFGAVSREFSEVCKAFPKSG